MGTENNPSRDFLLKRIAKKEEELAKVQSDLDEAPTQDIELKLTRKAERLLQEIIKLDDNLSQLDKDNSTPNIRHLNLEKSFQKIDFNEARKIAQSVNNKFGDASGAILLFFQRSTKQKGSYCIEEVLDLMIGDRKLRDDRGDFRPYPVDLGSSISEFNEHEFSQRLASHLSQNSEIPLRQSIQTLCSSLRGGSTVFIKIERCDDVIDKKGFLDWFMEEFWEVAICELNPIFQEYSKIRFIVALIANSEVFKKRSPLPEYFCKKNKFDQRKIIQLPLPDWTTEDIKKWLINFQGLSDANSLKLAEKIHKESEGTPHVICSILEKDFKVCQQING